MFPILLLLVAVVGLLVSAIQDRERTRAALRAASTSGLNLLPSLLGVLAAVGLLMAAIPPAAVARLFHSHGVLGFFLLSATGAVMVSPGPVAYPMLGSLRAMGASLPALAAFLTTLTMVGTLTAPLEIRTFGRRFTLLRQSLSLGLALLVGALMGALL
ncbi:MAG TPA: hypothetical protein VJ623_13200 [Holophagaceae bacterium]|nr:hypothetical protein [Holophagaceae bacterium]